MSAPWLALSMLSEWGVAKSLLLRAYWFIE